MSEDIQTTDQSVNTGDVATTEVVKEEVKTFTQEEVNGLVAKEAKKAQEKIFKSLGFEDVKSAKDGLKQLKEWQDSQKTEAEKKAEAIADKEKQLEAVILENKQLTAKYAALTLGVRSDAVDDVIALSQSKVTDDVTINDAIAEVLAKYPQFGNVPEETKEEPKPSFSIGGTPTVKEEGKVDPFEAIIASYGKK